MLTENYNKERPLSAWNKQMQCLQGEILHKKKKPKNWKVSKPSRQVSFTVEAFYITCSVKFQAGVTNNICYGILDMVP